MTVIEDRPTVDELITQLRKAEGEIDWLASQLRAKPANVIQALAAVINDMPGIGKDATSGEGGGPNYKYRSIESITAAAQPLLGKYGVVFVPRMVDRQTKDLSVNSKPWTQEEVAYEYTVYGPGGVNDHIVIGPIIGLGRDNSDKGIMKSATAAYKIALLQVLCIGDSKDDADQATHATDAPRAAVAPSPSAVLAERVRAMPGLAREAFPAFLDANGIPRKPADWSETHMATVAAWVDAFFETGEIVDAAGGSGTVPPTDDPREPPESPDGADTGVWGDPDTGPEKPTTAQNTDRIMSELNAGQHTEEAAAAIVAETAGAEAVDEEVERVKAMKAGEVRQALEAMGKPVDGGVDQLRKRLTIALLKERIAAKEVAE